MTRDDIFAQIKAALVELGVLRHATVRLPLVEATPDQRAALADGLCASGLSGAVAR